MGLHVVYRSTGPANRKNRPPFFSKALSLASLLHSAQRCADPPDLVFVNDGPMPDARLATMQAWGRVVPLPGLGNSGSYRRAVSVPAGEGWEGEDLVYLCEDDYLHLPDALPTLVAAAPGLPSAGYLTLYDHPDRYAGRRDWGRTEVMVAGGHHWRTVESSCMTFAARAATLRADRLWHWIATLPHTPRDRLLWLTCQRLGPLRALPRLPRVRRHGSAVPHRLVAALPSLASHLEEGCLSPVGNWEAAATGTEAWAREAGIPVSD